jgi:uncharacterized protein (TIGR02757 family)
VRRRPRLLSAARAALLRPRLEALEARLDRSLRIGFDPVEFPRRHDDPGDQEVAGLVAASLAYGRADVFKPVLERVLATLGPSPARFAESFSRAPDPAAFSGFLYRFNRPADVAALVAAIGHVRLAHGALGVRFAALFAEEGGDASALRPALARFARELREAPPVRPLLSRRGRRGLLHLLPDPSGPGASKRWNLYLRWMVRGPDGVDLGAWKGVPPSALVVPLDTHLHRIARCLGLTRRRDASWRTAEEITTSLRRIDPDDPVRHDFALCHLGMSGACPARRDPERCEACPLAEVCVGRSTLRSRPEARPGRKAQRVARRSLRSLTAPASLPAAPRAAGSATARRS